jgi:quinol monooxygenase YgiN
MIIELLSISASHGKKQELGKALKSLVGPIQVQQGCLRCRLFQDWPAEDDLHMEARWDSKEDLIGHLQSDIYKKLLLLIELSATPPGLEFLAVFEIHGLDLVKSVRISPD